MKRFKCKQGELEVVEENGKKYARCNNCGITLTANDLQTIATQRQSIHQASEEKKGNGLKIGLIIGGVFLVLFVLVGAIAIISSGDPSSESEKAVAKTDVQKKEAIKIDSDREADPADKQEADDKISSGSYEIDGVDVSFSDSVRNDVTGRWRLSRVATSKDIIEYAQAYHDTLFSSDDEVHAVVNFTLNTTTCLSMLSPDLMNIQVTEYVDKEEHDASELFSGSLLAVYHLTLSTGQLEKIQ